MKVNSVDVDAVLENQMQNYDVYVCVEKGVIATASIFSITVIWDILTFL